jgi:hypothetical protein
MLLTTINEIRLIFPQKKKKKKTKQNQIFFKTMLGLIDLNIIFFHKHNFLWV